MSDRTYIRIVFNIGVLPVVLSMASLSMAAEHFVPAGTSSVDCRSFNGGIKPGDTITLAAGERRGLTIRDCTGTAQNPITIRNDTSADRPTIISRASAGSGGFVFTIQSSEHFIIDGTGGWRGSSGHCGWLGGQLGTNCGIKITRTASGDSPTAFLKFAGLFRNYVVRGIHIDGRYWGDNPLSGGGAGIGVQQNSAEPASDHPGYWRENILYENNYVHNTQTEAFYIGPNHWSPPKIPLRNITIQDNYTHDTGRNSITIKSAIDGRNIIQRNFGQRTGLELVDPGLGGIHAFESTHIEIHNNMISDTYGHCFGLHTMNMPANYSLIGSGSYFHAENNLGVRCGSIGLSDRGRGITVGAAEGAPSVENVRIDFNTLVSTGGTGINIGTRIPGANTVIRNNIVTEPKSGTYITNTGTRENNLTGSVESVRFRDPQTDNFRLQADSPAVGAGTTPYPAIDLDGVSRPWGGGRPDTGAFEFAGDVAAPRAPDITVNVQ